MEGLQWVSWPKVPVDLVTAKSDRKIKGGSIGSFRCSCHVKKSAWGYSAFSSGSLISVEVDSKGQRCFIFLDSDGYQLEVINLAFLLLHLDINQ